MRLLKTIVLYLLAVGCIYFLVDKMFTSNSVDKIEIKDANKIEFVYDADGKYINDDVVPSNILLEWTRIYANKAFVNNENGNEYHIGFISSGKSNEENFEDLAYGTIEVGIRSCYLTYEYSQNGNVVNGRFKTTTCEGMRYPTIKIIVNKEKNNLLVEIEGKKLIFVPFDGYSENENIENSSVKNIAKSENVKCDVCGFGRYDVNGDCTHCDAASIQKEKYYENRLPDCQVCEGDGIEGFGRNQMICRICEGKGKQVY